MSNAATASWLIRWLNHKFVGGACLVADRRRRYRPPGGAAPRQVLTPGERDQSGPHCIIRNEHSLVPACKNNISTNHSHIIGLHNVVPIIVWAYINK